MITKKDILEKMPTMSSAIKAMVEGLKTAPFEIDMDTYGRKSLGVCYGCAATATVIKCWPELPVSSYERRQFNYTTKDHFGDEFQADLFQFENVIDDFRAGVPWTLMNYYGLNEYDLPPELHDSMSEIYFDTNNWERQSEKALAIAETLESLGY